MQRPLPLASSEGKVGHALVAAGIARTSKTRAKNGAPGVDPIRSVRHDGLMGFAGRVAGASAAGAVVGGAIGAQHAAGQEAEAAAIRTEDARRLAAGQRLPPMAEPPSVAPRKAWGLARCYLTGIGIGGFAAWLITVIIVMTLLAASNENLAVGEQLLGAQFVGFLAGLGGFVIPGLLPIGILLWLRETRARMRHSAAIFRRDTWEQRESMRAALESGQLTVRQALADLTGEPMRTTAVAPQPVMPIPTAGEPVEPRIILALSAAMASTTDGYIRSDEGAASTPATVLRILNDASAPERQHLKISESDVDEADEAFQWALGPNSGPSGNDYRNRLSRSATCPVLEPSGAESAIVVVASAIGGYRRARANGLA